MTSHGGAVGALIQGGANESEGRGGVWGSVAGGIDRGSSLQGDAGDWKTRGESAVLLGNN